MADTVSSHPDRHPGLLASVTGRLYGYLKSHRHLDAMAVWISRKVRDAPPSSGLNFVLGPLRARFRGEMTGQAMLEVVDALEARGVRFWIAGGWGIDLLEGSLTRRHDDLDVVLADYGADEPQVCEVLASKGYRRVEVLDGLWMNPRSLLDDGAGHQIEVLGFDRARLDDALGSPDAGRGSSSAIHDRYPELFTTGTFDGRPVPCLSVQLQLLFHTGFDLRAVDGPDIERLRAMAVER